MWIRQGSLVLDMGKLFKAKLKRSPVGRDWKPNPHSAPVWIRTGVLDAVDEARYHSPT